MCNYEHLSHAGMKLILQNYCCCPHVRKFNLQNLVEKEHTYNLPFSQLLSFSSHVRNLVFGTFWYFLATMLPKCYVIVFLIFFTEQGKTGKKETHRNENITTYFRYFGSFDEKRSYENMQPENM